MAGTIGIKLANGNFFPIMRGDTAEKKRLVLTTVHDNQESVQIDLFKSLSKSMLNAQYIGSLLVEDISPRPKGEPSIEMVISAGEDGTITADACDLDAGPNSEHHTLNVSLKTEDSSKSDRFPDFDLEGKRQTPTGLYGRAEFEREEERKYPWLIIALASVFVIVVVALLWFFFLGGRDQIFTGSAQGYQQTAPVTPPPQPPPVVEKIEPVAPPPPEPPKPVEPAPVIEAPTAPPPARPQTVQRTRPPAPVSSYKVPAVIPRNGVAYQIRWGDTLWDISEAFYRNPWLYPRIARYNNIRNPDLIIAGRTIRIPPRN